MADREKYVDIFFRNGLKEFEVLPPPEVWENIKPVLKRKERSLDFVRVAAMIAILVSLSVFSYRVTYQVTDEFNTPAISLNQDNIPDGSYLPYKPLISNSPRQGLPKTKQPSTLVNQVITSAPEQSNLKISANLFFSVPVREAGLQRGERKISPAEFRKNTVVYEQTDVKIASASDNKSGKGLNRWSLSALGSPDFYSGGGLGKSTSTGQTATSEKSIVSYSGGMSFAYEVSKRVSVSSGVYYSTIGQQINGIGSYSGFSNFTEAKGSSNFSVVTSNGTIVSTNNNLYLRDYYSSRVLTRYTSDVFDPNKANLTYLTNTITQNFNYLEIPLQIKYKAVDKRIDVNLTGGFSYNMLVGNSVFLSQNGVKYAVGKTEGINPMNFSSSLGLGLEYNLSEKISIGVEPTFRYFLTPFGKSVTSAGHPYALGVFSGLSYKF